MGTTEATLAFQNIRMRVGICRPVGRDSAPTNESRSPLSHDVELLLAVPVDGHVLR
jgi:hypothetical protein